MSSLAKTHPRPDLRTPFESAVPPTPGELAASSSERWERRGLLQRLVRVN